MPTSPSVVQDYKLFLEETFTRLGELISRTGDRTAASLATLKIAHALFEVASDHIFVLSRPLSEPLTAIPEDLLSQTQLSDLSRLTSLVLLHRGDAGGWLAAVKRAATDFECTYGKPDEFSRGILNHLSSRGIK